MKRRSENLSFLVLPILMFFVTIVLLAFGSDLLTSPKEDHFTSLFSGWSVQCAGNVYEDVTLSEFHPGHVRKGDVITISGTIPKTDIISPTIMFKSSHAATIVEIDGEEVYSFGTEFIEKGQIVPKRYNMVTIEDGSVEHDIRISFIGSDDFGLKGLFSVYFGTKHELMKYFFQYHRLSIFLGAFFAIYSLLLFSLGIFLFLYNKFEASVFISSAVSMLLGLYTYTYNDIFCFVTEHYLFFSLLEYFSLFLIPLAFSVLFHSTHPDISRTRLRFIIAINIILPIFFWTLHMLGIVQITNFVIPLQLIAVMEIVAVLPPMLSGIEAERKRKLESSTYTGVDADAYLLMGYVIMMIFTLLEIGKYTFTRFNENYERVNVFSSINFLNLGMLFFIICLFVYYFLNGVDHMNDQRLRKQLEGLAYTDALTGLMNRAKFMQYTASLKGYYAIVSLDLDRLKAVNDEYGHTEGDRMIRAFADILKESFEDASMLARTGGDEFAAAFEKPAADLCDNCVRRLEEKMAEFNKSNDKFSLSASAGYAYSHEVKGGSVDDVYFLADSRMYKVKEKHHG